MPTEHIRSNPPTQTPQGPRQCLYYFVHLDSQNRPIPNTMYAKATNTIDKGYKCREARLTGVKMTVPAGNVACTKNPSGLRYWYQIKQIPTGAGNSRIEVVPNSMIAVKGIPSPLAKHGTGGRPCQYIEFVVFESLTEPDAPEPFINLEAGV